MSNATLKQMTIIRGYLKSMGKEAMSQWMEDNTPDITPWTQLSSGQANRLIHMLPKNRQLAVRKVKDGQEPKGDEHLKGPA
jgi:hypothetical protein